RLHLDQVGQVAQRVLHTVDVDKIVGGYIHSVKLACFQSLVCYVQVQLPCHTAAASGRIAIQVHISYLHSNPVYSHITIHIAQVKCFLICLCVEESPAGVVRKLGIRLHDQFSQLKHIQCIDISTSVNVCSNSLVLAVKRLFLQYVTLNIDQVHSAHASRMTGILSRYKAHL